MGVEEENEVIQDSSCGRAAFPRTKPLSSSILARRLVNNRNRRESMYMLDVWLARSVAIRSSTPS